MSTIITSDLHFALGSSVEYRLGILKWLKEAAKKYKVDQVLILGDVTESKDEHSAHLVQAVTKGIYELGQVTRVIILRGNHDYLDPTTPFFGFLSKFPGVGFVVNPAEISLKINKSVNSTLFLPHTRDVSSDWDGFDFSGYDYIFVHHTFTGALAENGQKLKGTATSIFAGTEAVIYSGDIHVPQTLGPIEYVGSPYRMRFGDRFEPRLLLLKGGSVSELHYPCPNKHVVEVLKSGKFAFPTGTPDRDDLIKVRVHVEPGDFAEWNDIRQRVRDRCHKLDWFVITIEPLIEEQDPKSTKGVQSSFVDPTTTIKEFCKRRALDEKTGKTGRILLKDFEKGERV